jgi:hypothetical protein
MFDKWIKPGIRLTITVMLGVLTVVLAACSGFSFGPSGQTVESTSASSTIPTVVTSKANTGSSTGPRVTDGTPIPGGGRQVQLADRVLLITNVAKQSGADPSMVSIVLTLTVKNTGSGTVAIKNQPQFFLLVGSEGDTFGKQSNSSDTFFGDISANSQRSGTIVFQIPATASRGLRLMYQPENPADTSFMSLNL